MGKAAIWLLIGIGFLLFIIGLIFRATGVWVIGLLMIVGGFYFGLRPGGILRKEQVIDRWGVLIENGQGKGDEVVKDTDVFIKQSKAPSLKIESQDMAPGIIRGVLGTTRRFLVVTDQENYRLSPYQIFINARDYGNNLDVSWVVTYRPSVWMALLWLMFPFFSIVPKTLTDLDLFDQQDLIAYATNAHHCLLKAVDKLMIALHQDPSKIDRKSRGFLGIS